jgi:hypothetical protein
MGTVDRTVLRLQLERWRDRAGSSSGYGRCQLEGRNSEDELMGVWLLRERQHHELRHFCSHDLDRGARAQSSEHLQFMERQFLGFGLA